MTFNRTNHLVMMLTVFSISAIFAVCTVSGAARAQAPQAATPSSSPSLAGNQSEFEAGVRAYDAGDPTGAFAIWLPLAKAGDLAAQRNVAHLLRRGVGVDVDLVRALWFYERAARGGLASAALNAGMMRLEKDTDYFDEEKAAEWLALAASAGSPIAQWELAQLLENSEDVPRDEEAALILMKTAASAGHEEARARLAQLGILQRAPDALAPDQDDQVSPKGFTALVSPETGAAFMRGVFHFEAGEFAAAAAVWTPLAEKGVVEAQYRLGRLYQFGMGVSRDMNLARQWLDRAKNGGHPGAQVALSALSASADH